MPGETAHGTHAEAAALAEEILADAELNRIPLANITMKCARLARITGNEDALKWFQCEIGGYPSPLDDLSFRLGLAAGRSVSGTENQENGPKIWTGSIPAIEVSISTLRQELSTLNLPSLSLAEGESSGPFHVPGLSLTGIVNSVLQRRREILAQVSRDAAILARVRASVYRWALETYHVLRFGSTPSDAFQTARTLVETHLGAISADALQKFVAAQQRALSGSPEEWSQALVSLRRLLKTVADVLYTPTDTVIDGHPLHDENYINRLWQFVKERTRGDQAAILAAEVQFIGQRIDALYDLTNKGTHDAVGRTEVDLAVVHIYLLVADLLSLLSPDELGRLAQAPAAFGSNGGMAPKASG